MSIPKHISEFLDSQHIAYQHCIHSPAYTAQGIAHTQHISGKEIAKVVMVVADGSMVMAVLPGNHRIDLDLLKRLLNVETIRLAIESEFRDHFPDCELGAMPPFGNLYHLEVWMDESLKAHSNIVFNAGTHAETIQMGYSDFERLVHPHMGNFSVLMH
ncbi:MAG: YbaK/prolyl-tRNA synthetase associated region [Acidobacteria bacterium]|jgi:Ala-tRNA(Pro) deacylase|nr:YbaK/prolyl-tRNA synthetase associated region [Acidobacteriota bacterium]